MALAVLLLAVSRPFEAAPVGATIEGRRFATGTVSTYRRGHAATAWQAAAATAHWAESDGGGLSPSQKALQWALLNFEYEVSHCLENFY